MPRTRVLHLITHLGVGGALDNTLLTVRELSRERYQVDLGAGVLTAEERSYTEWEARGREFADSLFVFPELQRPVRYTQDLRALQRISAFLRERGYQIVHTHTAKAGFVGRLAARRARVPVVVHTYHAFPWQVARGDGAGTWPRWKSRLRKRIYVALERYAASLSDALVTVAELNRREAVELGLAPPEKFTTIYSGVDVERLRVPADREATCRALGLDATRPIVGYVGRLSEQKAPVDFVRAAKAVLGRRPEAQCILVGDGPLEGVVREAIGDEVRIRLLGYREDVPAVLSVLDAFVLSSLWEGLGRALTEAMVAGAPVAATAVNGVPELIVHGRTGLLSPAGDPARLAENVLRLLERPDEARGMSREARERVVGTFGVREMVERIDALYVRLLRSKGCA